MNVKDKIVELSKMLDEIDNYINTLSDLLSYVDSKICDLMHLIENNNLKTNQCYRVIKELHNLRLERRKIKNDMELTKTYKLHINQLNNIQNRQFLISTICKLDKKLLNSKYTNRVYTEEEINNLIGV